MTSIRDSLEMAIQYEDSLLAHHIFYLLQEGKISPDEDAATLKKHKPNEVKLRQLVQENILGICPVKIYSLKRKPYHFSFIYAKTEEEAITCFLLEYGIEPLNCHELFLDELMWWGGRAMTFREIKKEMDSFPCLLGEYETPYWNVKG